MRIGRAAVMPGDIVLGKKEGVIFIPAHLAQEVVETSEIVRMRDQARTGKCDDRRANGAERPSVE